MSRWLSPLMAFCLSFILIAGLAPSLGLSVERQIDFWMLWLGTMLLLALPIAYLEVALAKRSKTTALNALSSLTRDADVSPRWRIVGWLAVVFIPFLAGGILFNITAMNLKPSAIPFEQHWVLLACMVLAFALSYLSRQILILLTVVAVFASLLFANIYPAQLGAWQMTEVGFAEWGNATILALVATGLGLGVYWQSSLTTVQQQGSVSKTVFPIWLGQLLAVVAFAYFGVNAQLPALSIVLSVVMAAALLLQVARVQLQHRQVAVPLQYVICIVALAVWLVPELAQWLNPALMLWGLVICLIYSVFVGWMMKISHLRKAMNLGNEGLYNLWRIAVRIVLPISIVLAMISFIGQMI